MNLFAWLAQMAGVPADKVKAVLEAGRDHGPEELRPVAQQIIDEFEGERSEEQLRELLDKGIDQVKALARGEVKPRDNASDAA